MVSGKRLTLDFVRKLTYDWLTKNFDESLAHFVDWEAAHLERLFVRNSQMLFQLHHSLVLEHDVLVADHLDQLVDVHCHAEIHCCKMLTPLRNIADPVSDPK